MEQKKTWLKFKTSVLFVDDIEKRRRLWLLVDSIVDPFATTIRYHLKCFKDYMRPVYKEQCDAHIQHVNGAEVKQKFLEDIRKKIFEDGEPRTLKSLAADYEKMRANFNVQTTVRTWLLG